MSQIRALSSPELLPSSPSHVGRPVEDVSFEGLSANVRLLLKLIQDHNGGSPKDNDERKSQRVAGMISIIDEVRGRIHRIQTTTKRRAELRRCHTDLKPNVPRDKHVITDEKERLRKELNASLIARRSLQAMCSSLGKEKEIMASELARKAQELTEMEEYINDLKSQNEMLLEKLQALHKEKKNNGEPMEGNEAPQERNKVLEEQLRKSLDGYRSLKRKYKETQKENLEFHTTMEEMDVEVQAGIDRIHSFKEEMATNEETEKIKGEISAIENLLESLSLKISKHRQQNTDYDK